jgi:hypothetical protein
MDFYYQIEEKKREKYRKRVLAPVCKIRKKEE